MTQPCAACHPDHAGRDFALISWTEGDPARFDHRRTGWTLEGSHGKVECAKCHKFYEPKSYSEPDWRRWMESMSRKAKLKTEDDKLLVARARKIERFLSQPFFTAAQFTGREGRYVSLRETVRGFREILEGKHDDLPEQAFYMVGTIDEAVALGEKMKQEA